jgi:uncharacterized protein with NRDE domain
MCIVLLTTAHPSYALIAIDNRDEFVRRPTSRPHWWTSNHQEVLSARDQQREEQGTWFGITKTGKLAVLTNYRETNMADADHPVQGARSRGGMVTAWLTGPEEETTQDFVHRLLEGGGLKSVGGFSLVCGKLRRREDLAAGLEPLAIVSNRSGSPDDVPWLLEKRDVVYGLSNTSYDDPVTWPKVKMGQEGLLKIIEEAIETGSGEEQDGQDFESYIYQLRKSIFIPAIGQEAAGRVAPTSNQTNTASRPTAPVRESERRSSESELRDEERPDAVTNDCMSGIYGTQRQTILLVDWKGRATFFERSLWDEAGNPIERGKGDMKFEFQIEGWDEQKVGN